MREGKSTTPSRGRKFLFKLFPPVTLEAHRLHFTRYLFDLDHWHIKQPPENLASIDPAGAYIAQQAAAILQEEDEQSAADDEGSKGTLYNSFFTGTRSIF